MLSGRCCCHRFDQIRSDLSFILCGFTLSVPRYLMKRSRSVGVAPGVVEIGNFLKVIGTLGDKEDCAAVARV